MNITLIGYRGTGKSTIARLLAERLGWDWVDADAYLEQQAGRSIRQIFETEGEVGFREREADVIRELTGRNRWVIAAGGGAVIQQQNRRAIRRSGRTVWLVASPDVIHARIAGDSSSDQRRPQLTPQGGIEEIRRLLREREPWYRECADLVVDTDRCPPERAADEIARAFPNVRGQTPTE